ncbi:exodeoxyribonuclease VII large subunit [Rivularia sp. UHCC 0363]|uniref:exodeoxyribonuclease VII large subunit n=1 Tax=Rivularia sp. UHCC 0363 TaxID=3110244 RepID=UPI002B214BAD|nr:exodeoxyribonuclease VII large subunit [Rivularia sp. UHCC 0363]MEA5595216.1 exodeoxyribonuclease VII large subunit [Rivularia sp. UHCC 0363]
MNSEPKNSLIPDSALSIAGLTNYIQLLLEEDPTLRQVWVTGEVSSANNHRAGLFFTLQDTDGDAAIKCVTWKGQIPKLAQMPVVGEQLIVLGSIRLYPARGEYQLTVWQAIPAGEGLQALRYKQLKTRLMAEGLFDDERKQPLPEHPQTIAVVTSPTAAAWGDIQKTLKSRYPGLHILFSPATVQGEQAPNSIVKAIQRVEHDGRAEVLILARGGGAVEELACFNDERVVRAIADCSIPIITGIGHQRDESLADLVADQSVHTPTAAAEIVVPSLNDLYSQHCDRAAALSEVVNYSIETAQNQVETLRNRLRRSRLDKQVEQEIQALTWKREKLLQAMNSNSLESKQRLEVLRQKLITLNPRAVLQRGYAVVRKENKSIARNASELEIGEELLIYLGKGTAKVKVIDIKD